MKHVKEQVAIRLDREVLDSLPRDRERLADTAECGPEGLAQVPFTVIPV